jgi:hypothetical protein
VRVVVADAVADLEAEEEELTERVAVVVLEAVDDVVPVRVDVMEVVKRADAVGVFEGGIVRVLVRL